MALPRLTPNFHFQFRRAGESTPWTTLPRSSTIGDRRRSRKGSFIVRRFTAIFLAALLAACIGRGKKDEKYKTEPVTRGTITMTVTATGTLSAVTTVQVGSQVSGVIAALHADFNSRVTKGQLLAELDPTPFQQTVEQRQADVTKSRIEAANSKISYDRQSRLAKAGLA